MSGEFVNVGVALYSPQARYLSAVCRTTHGRLSRMFPGFNPEHFKSLMRYIQSSFEERGTQLANELPLSTAPGVLEVAHLILPKDDSSLQWSPAGSGITDDPSQTLERLFDRLVSRYEDAYSVPGRSDEDVWRHFKRDLEERHVMQHLQPKKITVEDDEIEFLHTWKNGRWNCLEPLSFDLASADSIKDKAHRWLGHLSSVKESPDPFKVYLLVGAPKQEVLQTAFESAVSILKKIPVQSEVVLESDARNLASRIEAEISAH